MYEVKAIYSSALSTENFSTMYITLGCRDIGLTKIAGTVHFYNKQEKIAIKELFQKQNNTKNRHVLNANQEIIRMSNGDTQLPRALLTNHQLWSACQVKVAK